jgi:hypothetical protein
MCRWLAAALLLLSMGVGPVEGAPPARKYFAHPAVEDGDGVIAPWYRGQNGQCDFRIRVAAETLKRYPWADKDLAVMAAPHYVFNGSWAIKPDGTIQVNPKLSDWNNGDVGQRSASLLTGMTNYYRYTGDPAAIGILSLTADYVLDYCQTSAGHRWPRFFISCPTKGKAYGRADAHGFIQLDVSAQVGSGLVGAYKLTGNPRYLEAVCHWADLLAEHADLGATGSPWDRYANPEDSKWKDTRQTAGVSLILQFLDDVIGLGHCGKGDGLVKARAAGDRYLRDVLLPEWSRDPTWGHHFWDWLNPVTTCSTPCYTATYMMNRPECFPQWRTDIRNFVSLFFCRTSVNPASKADVYSGAWASPEATNCCGKSLQYPTMNLAATLARFGAVTGDAWAREVARRQTLLVTYDAHETGVVEDGIDGGAVVAGAWFNLAHPWPLKTVLECLAWQPDTMGAGRENHIMRSSSVVREVCHGKGRVAYATFDAKTPCEDVLRLAFRPRSVRADGTAIGERSALTENGYLVKTLSNGDYLVTVRHDGLRRVVVEGDDPQQSLDDDRLQYAGAWSVVDSPEGAGRRLHMASRAGASVSFEFTGNQVRLIGRADPEGGRADVYLDGVRQLAGIDFWCPQTRHQQVLCYKNGLTQGKHTLKVVTLGTRNPVSRGTRVYLDSVQWSAAQGRADFGAGSGPGGAQRVIFGYLGRTDYVDSQGHAWRPATEWIMRLKALADVVPIAMWTEPRVKEVAGTADAELYRYGAFGSDFTAHFTVHPQPTYYVRIKLCEAGASSPAGRHATSIAIQGQTVASDVDIAATAGGAGRAVDLVFNGVRPAHGVIAIRFWHRAAGQAMVQAIEVGPGQSAAGAKPMSFAFPTDTERP